MSQFYWQNVLEPSAEQRQGQHMANAAPQGSTGWSSIGLAGGNDRWPTQFPQLGTDPYSAAVFQGFNNSSSGYQYPSQSQQYPFLTGNSEEDAHAVYHNQVHAGGVDRRGMHVESNPTIHRAQAHPTQKTKHKSHKQHSFGIHQPILPQTGVQKSGSMNMDAQSDWMNDRSSHNERMCSEPPRLDGNVADAITGQDLTSKGSASCEVIMRGSTDTVMSSMEPGSTETLMLLDGIGAAANYPNAAVSSDQVDKISAQQQSVYDQQHQQQFANHQNNHPMQHDVVFGAEAEKKAEQMRRSQRGSDKNSAVVAKETFNPPVSAVEWDRVHSPVAVAQVTPMVTTHPHLAPVPEVPIEHLEQDNSTVSPQNVQQQAVAQLPSMDIVPSAPPIQTQNEMMAGGNMPLIETSGGLNQSQMVPSGQVAPLMVMAGGVHQDGGVHMMVAPGAVQNDVMKQDDAMNSNGVMNQIDVIHQNDVIKQTEMLQTDSQRVEPSSVFTAPVQGQNEVVPVHHMVQPGIVATMPQFTQQPGQIPTQGVQNGVVDQAQVQMQGVEQVRRHTQEDSTNVQQMANTYARNLNHVINQNDVINQMEMLQAASQGVEQSSVFPAPVQGQNEIVPVPHMVQTGIGAIMPQITQQPGEIPSQGVQNGMGQVQMQVPSGEVAPQMLMAGGVHQSGGVHMMTASGSVQNDVINRNGVVTQGQMQVIDQVRRPEQEDSTNVQQMSSLSEVGAVVESRNVNQNQNVNQNSNPNVNPNPNLPKAESVQQTTVGQVAPMGAISQIIGVVSGGKVHVTAGEDNRMEQMNQERQQLAMPQTPIPSIPPQLSTVTGANVARVGPLSSQQNEGDVVHASSANAPVRAEIEAVSVTRSEEIPERNPPEGSRVGLVELLQGDNTMPPPVLNRPSPVVQGAIGVMPKQTGTNAETTAVANKDSAPPKVSREFTLGSAEPSTDSTAQEESASVQGGARATKKEGNGKKGVRERYKCIREQYPEVMKRLDRHKTDMSALLEWRTPPRNVMLMPVGQANSSKTPGAGNGNAVKSSTPKESESLMTVLNHPDVSAIHERPFSKMSHSFTVPDTLDWERNNMREMDAYGEDFVNLHRRSRYSRNRAPSRGAKSEMGELDGYSNVGYRPHPKDSFYAYDNAPAAYSSSYAVGGNYASGRHSLGPVHSRYYQDQPYPYQGMEPPMRRRPQSTFDTRAYNRYEQTGAYHGGYDAYRDRRKDTKEGYTSETDEDSLETDDEMAQIHKQQMMAKRSNSMRTVGSLGMDPEERYYLGVIQLPQDRVHQLLHKCPPPPEYVHLPAIERVAFLFYCALYKRHFHPVEVFHKRFNREFYNYTCDGDSSEIALWKICKHTQDEYNSKRSANHLKAYEKSQMQLFSDDRETLDSRVSDRGSHELEEDSDRQSVDSARREPMKFRSAHALMRFGVGGKVLLLDPTQSVSVVEVRDVKTLLKDNLTQRIVDTAESFKGPLIAGVTPTHSVRLYVQRQIERILKCDAYRDNPAGGGANDALLVWQLLEMVVQQQGRVTGPDLSRLLLSGCHGKRGNGRDKKTASLSPPPDERTADPEAYDRFTQFLLGGHIDEAIESAMRDGLYADAMVLTRRVCANDQRKVDKVETAFLAHRAENNPVMTLLSVASDMPAPVLTNPPNDDTGSWRSHVAVVLANLNTPTAFNTVYHLGRVLARRHCHAAADFCWLAVNLLAGYDPFQPVAASSEEDADVRQHISLIHASIPDDEDDTSTVSRCGLSLTDLHATEIYEYATRLANNGMPTALTVSLEYQLSRLQYATLISNCGGFSTDAFRYCLEVARGVWDRSTLLTNDNLNELCDLADRLQYVATADASETAWIAGMRSIVEQRGDQFQPQQQGAAVEQQQMQQTANDGVMQPETQPSGQPSSANTVDGERSRTMSLSCEAADWHAEHQEPLRMAHVEGSAEQVTATAQPEHEQQTHTANAAHNDHHQHHILQQRKSQSNSFSSTAAQASHAFPPSLPESGEVPSVVQQQQPEQQQGQSQQFESRSTTVETVTANGGHDTTTRYQSTESKQATLTNERRDSYANGGITIPSITVSQQQWQAGVTVSTDTVRGQPSTTSIDSSSMGGGGSSLRMSLDKEPSNETITTTMSMNSTVNDSVFMQESNETFGTPSEKAPPRPMPHSAVYENTHQTAPLPPQPLSAPPTMDEQPKPKPKSDDDHANKNVGGSQAHSSGLFSMLKARIVKAIPSGNEMILPDDSHPAIVWDPVQNKYVGGGVVEEKAISTPPPSNANSAVFDPSTHGSSGGLRAARVSGGSRYFNPMSDASAGSTQRLSSPAPTMMPIPTTSFGFIPAMPDDADNSEAFSPFSENTAPIEQPAATPAASQ